MTGTHRNATWRTLPPTRAAILAAVLLGVGATAVPVADAASGAERQADATRPHVITTDIADVIVRIRGGAVCTGTPITGTTFVVTAAHCVVDHDGRIGSRKVVRNGIEYTPVSVLVHPQYHLSTGPELDVAVLMMKERIPGPSATVGRVLPTVGRVTLVGFQPIDTDGSLLRGTRYNNRPLPKGSIGHIVTINTAAAGCLQDASDLEIAHTQVKIACGLIPGASGGGLFVEHGSEKILIGITSTVAQDLSYNGLVPLIALHQLLDNPPAFINKMPLGAATDSGSKVVRA
jgi:trypsin